MSGPDFSFAASALGGITNVANYITATNTNTTMTIQFQGNNVRKFGCNANAINAAATATTSDIVTVTATTNLNNNVSQNTVNGSRFAGFSVSGGENEYIVSIQIQFQSTPSPAARIAIEHIIFGDNTPQNVALHFDGVNDYVEIQDVTVGSFGTNQHFTITCWIKPDPTATGEQNVINKYNGNGGYAFTIRYYGTSGTVLGGQYDGVNFPHVQSTTNLKDGKWHHVAFVKNGADLLLYIDGTQEGPTGNDFATGWTPNDTPLQIGREATGTKYFKGEIDEVRIWTSAKSETTIQNEMFCKTPNFTDLEASYSFSNGVPNDINTFITQVQTAVGTTKNGTLNGFAKTGDASNFVTGQVKYVYSGAEGNYNGSSWLNGFYYLQSALSPNNCNHLFDVYVASGFYKPDASNTAISFNIPSGMRLYGGFAGTEKSINQRNLALIHSTNKTTLTGDLSGNDTPFNFTTNRTDNSNYPVNITGSNVVFDGFTVSGASANGGGIKIDGTNATIKNSIVIDNANPGLLIFGGNATIANCSIMGNKSLGINIGNSTASIKESLIANNGFTGIDIYVTNGTRQTTITNSTIASNADYGIDVVTLAGTSTNTLKNTLIYGNASGGISNDNSNGGTINNTITYSLVQGDAGGTNGNLNGNTVNPQFVSPLANNVRSDAGDYRLKWCSFAINAGTNTGISPLDLDRKPRNFNGNTDMGAYEFLGNTPSQLPTSTISGTVDSPTYAGGAIQTITSTAKILAPAGAIDFKAPNSIILSPGFEARGVGKYFKAEIGANVGCVN